MAVVADIARLDLFLQMKFTGLDLNSLSIADFHPGGCYRGVCQTPSRILSGPSVWELC